MATKAVTVIGMGERAGIVRWLLENRDLSIAAVYDPDQGRAAEALKHWQSPDSEICDSYEQAIRRDDVDWVMIFSPNAFHKEHILCAFDAGKHVFCEKPLATTIEDCQEIYTAHQKSGLTFATGFVLRYAPLYRKLKELLDQGYIGKILSIDANENIAPGHGAYIMKNWRRHTALSGPHILEKCCHDLDLLNWFCQSVPSRIASFGGRNFFVPENKDFHERFQDENGTSLFKGDWLDPQAVACAFTSEKDLMDNQVAILEYRNQIRVMFQATMSNAIPERRMYLSGTEGTLIAELYSGVLTGKRIGGELETFELPGGGHGGGDAVQLAELYETMTEGVPPKCSGDEGLESAVVALGIEDAKDRGQVLDMEPIWKKLNR